MGEKSRHRNAARNDGFFDPRPRLDDVPFTGEKMALKRQLPADPLSLTPVYPGVHGQNMSLSLTPGLLILEQGLFNGMQS